ncbi:MAG: FAD binding domain-containing protein [Gammaproteobacteria bacterium]|nr:FAD binding domain-containing protein [Gammaproteobacteria bacterium]
MSLIGLEQYHRPRRLQDVAALLAQYEDEALIVSGGTFIHGLAARGLVADVKHLIDINDLDLDYINVNGEQLRIGATSLLRQLENNPDIQQEPGLGAIRDALKYPPAQIKNAASIGGSVASACPFLDLPISLLAQDADIVAYGSGGARDIRLEAFFLSLFENALHEDELLQEIRLPLKQDSASAFEKLETNANDLAILNAAAAISASGNSCTAVRVFVGGGVGEVPARAVSVEKALNGKELNRAGIEQAAALAKDDVDPLSDHRGSARYRTAMAEVLVRRCLNRCLARLGVSG